MRLEDAPYGSYVELELVNGKTLRGILMPRSELDPEDIVVLKLDNGYNVGIKTDKIKAFRVIKEYVPEKEVKRKITQREDLPRIGLFATGGTIGSKVDYATGAVTAKYSAEDILDLVPEISEIANIEGFLIFNKLSENLTPRDWKLIASKVAEKLDEFEGVVITHGTDTMAFTASALSFMFERLGKPVILTGAQRSSDRPSSDVHLNLLASVRLAATGRIAEVMVVMHGETEDTYALAHRGVRVKKLHTSRRDAFVTVNDVPLAKIWKDHIEYLREDYRPRSSEPAELFQDLEERVAIVKYYPGMDPEILELLVDRGYRGILLEGTGLGHVGEHLLPVIQRGREEGVIFAMVSQCIWGRINMNVYSTGRRLLRLGVLPAEDMTLEAAYAKLMYLLGKYPGDEQKIRELFGKNLRGELSLRSNYLVSRPPKFYYHENCF
jgi:glutamyl-tRNA(Gln) amidotransferase subunit D